MLLRALFYFLFFIAFIVAVGGAIYLYFFLSTFVVINNTDREISNIAIKIVDENLWSGALKAKQSKRLYGFVEGEGSMAISYNVDGHTVTRKCGYYTSALSSHETITLTADGPIFRLSDNAEQGFLCE